MGQALFLTMPRPALTITASNQPDPRLVAEAAVALILDFHAKTSRPDVHQELPPDPGEPDPDDGAIP